MDHHLTPLDVTQLPTWKGLRQHRQDLAGFSLRQAFAEDPERFKRFSLSACGLLLDFSKNLIRTDTLELLVKLAEEARLDEAIKAMFRGDMTEQRPRAPSSASAQVISSIELRPISPGKGAGGRRPPRPSSAGGANVVTTRP